MARRGILTLAVKILDHDYLLSLTTVRVFSFLHLYERRRLVRGQAHAAVPNILERPVILCYNIGGALKFYPVFTNQHFPQNVLFKYFLSVGIIESQQNNRKGETK